MHATRLLSITHHIRVPRLTDLAIAASSTAALAGLIVASVR